MKLEARIQRFVPNRSGEGPILQLTTSQDGYETTKNYQHIAEISQRAETLTNSGLKRLIIGAGAALVLVAGATDLMLEMSGKPTFGIRNHIYAAGVLFASALTTAVALPSGYRTIRMAEKIGYAVSRYIDKNYTRDYAAESSTEVLST
ncbi:hypothetical protein A2631_01980 [Candidatus Daviesbacteria bacterium RIFCSPHIGHO2_01_FULL_44_29]|uniref:Uncharacterized protein n=1 Tax=Candidatus Daviesbacteria bacterium RIFCSPHIGHO2_02_FULL_43_12 TaxID=1797776 RepID=A0A1F5KK45_9BACT|nr:MAG: hypothetical protein A2631_01980 [Candidatus Daviesbacteria bacterium RIFCSPHIGHO2_01_FULL_44_29]OGE39559.1 MAG: hypothetical protein A3E86_01920 [Candidatus Daviesbacteria bacterium RIFCSPHIGHO2_12_FULL_47_45]OGE41165.1 MAG: hypothetical protein A3D25_01375 [Candidatus Daviesbacteria bacterium RIFCSPHIGHO2_02_FULL_43_12]OGE69364.1 MAG: hypothetical protein A3B55_03115 [Candidatus Daviesbacteria bacterium RIFCSPLOWO2_01_FULL_43_15]